MATVKLQLLLRPEFRSPAGVEMGAAAACELGLHITHKGAATLSAQLDEQRFAATFGAEARAVPERKRGDADFGAPAGFELESQEPLRVPSKLARFFESVEVAPPYIRLR